MRTKYALGFRAGESGYMACGTVFIKQLPTDQKECDFWYKNRHLSPDEVQKAWKARTASKNQELVTQ